MRNPGTLLISIPQYYEGGHSECRNPSLQKMFGLIGRSDKAGSGVDKIIEGWKFAKWRRPYISEKSHPDFVELYLPLESLFSENTLDELKELYGNVVTERPHNELIILALALTEGEVSNSSLQNMVALHPSFYERCARKIFLSTPVLAEAQLIKSIKTTLQVPTPLQALILQVQATLQTPMLQVRILILR